MKRYSQGRLALYLHKLSLAVCTLVVFVLLVSPLKSQMFSIWNDYNHNGSDAGVQTYLHKVSAGDTLWSLAGATATKDEDVRDRIIAIRNLNKLSGSQNLIPGQLIQIPVKTDREPLVKYSAKYTLNSP